MDERRGELLQAAAIVVELREEGAVDARLERLLEGRDQDHGEESQSDRRAGDDRGSVAADLPTQGEERHAAGNEDGRGGEGEAHRLADDVVDVHQPMTGDRVGDDPEVDGVSEAPEGIDVDPVERQQIGHDEGARGADRQEPELGLGPLPGGGRAPVGVRDAGDRQR